MVTYGENVVENIRQQQHGSMEQQQRLCHGIKFNQPEVVMSNSEVTGRNECRHESRQIRQVVISSKTELCGELDWHKDAWSQSTDEGDASHGICKSQRIRAGRLVHYADDNNDNIVITKRNNKMTLMSM